MIIIRADANETIGIGHIMRCVSIASALVEKGEEVLFVKADHRGDDLIGDYKSICLDTDYTDYEGELDKWPLIISKYNPSFVLIDSYFVTNNYFDVLGKLVKTVYIDDLNADCWNVDFLINYNIFASALDYSCYGDKKTKLCLGVEYVPLREEFQNPPARIIKDSVTDILISTGGTDLNNLSEELIEVLCKTWPKIDFHWVVSSLNPQMKRISEFKMHNLIIHLDEKCVSSLMLKCDAAVSAAGTTLYELCSTGTPTVTYVLADNQINAANQFEKQRIMLNAGDFRRNKDFVNDIVENLRILINNKKTREEFALKMQHFVDGRGKYRIIEELNNVL